MIGCCMWVKGPGDSGHRVLAQFPPVPVSADWQGACSAGLGEPGAKRGFPGADLG